MPARYDGHIDEESIAVLQALRGARILALYTMGLRVEWPRLLSPCFSISVQNGDFIVVENDWGETRESLTDYHRLSLREKTLPKELDAVKSERGVVSIGSPHSSVRVFPGRKPPLLEAVHVYEQDLSNEDEHIRFDSALVLEHERGEKLLLGPQLQPAGGVTFTWDTKQIEEAESTYRRRITIG